MFCVDFRQLNAITKPLAVPLPLIDGILALLGKSQCFFYFGFEIGLLAGGPEQRGPRKDCIHLSHGPFQF